jgi:hypothetical protein
LKEAKENMNQDETIPTVEPTPKKTKYVLIILVVGIMIFSCIVIGFYFLSMNSGITNADSSKFVGTWKYESGGSIYHIEAYIFYSNGSVYEFNWNGYVGWFEYIVAEDELIIGNDTYKFKFSDDNQKLILDGTVYNRV